jgi:renal tumor antigen
MDIWGLGCVFFEIMSLYPLFPGTNELDQVAKIHQIMGTPGQELLNHFQKKSSHMDFNFPKQEGTGLEKMLTHVVSDCIDLLYKLLAYKPDDRVSARQALRHPHFRELRDAEKRNQKVARQAQPQAPSSPAPSNASAMTARSTESKAREGGKGGATISSNKNEPIKDMQKTHKSLSNATGSAQSKVTGKSTRATVQMDDPEERSSLPPINNKSVSLVIDTHGTHTGPKKLHKQASKPAATLRGGNKGNKGTLIHRKKDKDLSQGGLSVYNSSNATGRS